MVLATLSPGVIPVTTANPFLGTGSFNSNGGRGRANNITIDNVVATDVSTTGTAGFGTLSLDAIQEFKVITNNFNAEYGRNSGSECDSQNNHSQITIPNKHSKFRLLTEDQVAESVLRS